jgi:hypothetical protein
MKAYSGIFKKVDGSMRHMVFVRLEDLPKSFLEERLKGNSKRKLSEGLELVWDLELREFRIFNWKTLLGEVKQTDINFVL